MAESNGANELGFDPDALRERYRHERDKRMRSDGTAQYIAPKGDFAYFVEDPYSGPPAPREALTDEVDVLIVGAGFAGLSAGAHLRMAGVDKIRLVEKAGDVGGTWYWNRYPGLQCDIESYVYLPLLEETNFIPTERYSRGSEIFEHARRIARQYDLYRDALFQTGVTEMRWIEVEQKWLVKTDRGDAVKARFVVQTNGLLDRPKLPAIPGIDKFKGHSFHTSRWDYDYTGGDPSGGLSKLADKRVAVIGTGATAIQVVPHVGRHAKKLYVVQRTPSGVDERGNRPTDPAWAKSLTPGWHRERRENFIALTSGLPRDVDLVGDGWTDAVRNLGSFNVASDQMSTTTLKEQAELADFRKMNSIRARVDSIVEDPKIAEALKPWYRQFCKRPTFNDDYLPTFNRPNVELIDTNGQGLEGFTEKGFLFEGREIEVDCVIFATGFEYGASFTTTAHQKGHPIIGRTGEPLIEAWKNGLSTLHGFYSHGFPNLFQMGGSQNSVAFASTYYLDEQAEHIAAVVSTAHEKQATVIEPDPEAEAAWVAVIRAKDKSAQEFQRECTPGFYNEEGKVGEKISRLDESYGGGPIDFYALIRRWRDEGMPGLTFSRG